jgi:hypothetical protein
VIDPTRKGFGTKLIQENLAAALDGAVELEFQSNGWSAQSAHQFRTFSTTGGVGAPCPLWVITDVLAMSELSLLYPRKRTSCWSRRMSAKCQERTSLGEDPRNAKPVASASEIDVKSQTNSRTKVLCEVDPGTAAKYVACTITAGES